jgi:hypothetical protein
MPMRRRPSRGSTPCPASSAARVRIRPTVRQATRSSSATAAWEVWTASHAAVSSNPRVNPAPCLAQGRRRPPRRAGGSALWARRPPTTPARSQGPAPASAVDLALIEAGAASAADPTAPPAPSCRSHRRHDRVGLLIEADRFHDGVLDAEQPCPYPSYLHAVSPFYGVSLGQPEPSGGTACSHTGTLTAPTDGAQEPTNGEQGVAQSRRSRVATVARRSGTSGDGSGGWSMAVVVVPGARLMVAYALAGLAACWMVVCRHSLSRLWVPHSSFHSAWQAASPRRKNRRVPCCSLIWPKTGSTVSLRLA